MNYTQIFFDTETTGNGPADRLCQLCYRAWRGNAFESEHNELYTPTHPISIESMAVHHITNKMIAGKPAFQDSPEYPTIKELFERDSTIVIAHNVQFDLIMMAHEDINPKHFIDTLKLIRYLDSEGVIPQHNLQFLRYYYQLDDNLPEGTLISAHDALGDVLILEQLYYKIHAMFRERNPEMSDITLISLMADISKKPTKIIRFNFGKYKGQTVNEVAKIDRGYLEWLLNEKRKCAANGENEEDWIMTLEEVIKQAL